MFLEGVAGQAGDRGVRVETPGIGVVSLAVIVGQSLGDLLEIVTRVTMVPSEFFNRSSDSRPRNKSFSNRSTTDLGIIIPIFVTLLLVAHPTILLENKSIITERYSQSSFVQIEVISPAHIQNKMCPVTHLTFSILCG